MKNYLGTALLLAALSFNTCVPEEEEIKPYGCKAKEVCQQKAGETGEYECKINGRFYEHATGLKLKNSEVLDIQASGTVDWGYCSADPDGSSCAWGLWLRLGQDKKTLRHISKNYRQTLDELADSQEAELFFIIPDGSNEEYCPYTFYSDNSGEYKAVLKILEK